MIDCNITITTNGVEITQKGYPNEILKNQECKQGFEFNKNEIVTLTFLELFLHPHNYLPMDPNHICDE